MAWATKYQGLNLVQVLEKGRGRPIKWVVVSHGTRGGTQLEEGTRTPLSHPGILRALFKSRPSNRAHPRMPNAANKKMKKPTAPRYTV